MGAATLHDRRATRGITLLALAFAGLYYLQFGLQALSHHVPQGVLTLVGAGALLWATWLASRRRHAAEVAFLGTVPILLLHAAMTVEDPAELIFLIGSVPVPAIAGLAWALRGMRSTDER